MSAMMRSNSAGWHCDRASQRWDWRRVEEKQLAPWEPRPGEVDIPFLNLLEPDIALYGYWSVVRDLDEMLNEQARPHLAGATRES